MERKTQGMTASDFKNWFRGFSEGIRNADGEIRDSQEIDEVVKRIEEEVEKIDAAPTPFIWPQDWWQIVPQYDTFTNPTVTIASDCLCPAGVVCNSTACPRAMTYSHSAFDSCGECYTQ
jgi:hypothetical protein